MRRTIGRLISATTAVLLLVALTLPPPGIVMADTVGGPSLIISQLKITSSNGQFVTLYNATDSTLDMSRYQLEYFNNYDLGKATSSRLIGLSGNLPPHSYYMINDASLLLCYRLAVNSVSLGFSSTAGLVEVLAFGQAGPGSAVTPVLQDYVGWSKTAAAGAQTLPASTAAFLQRQPVDTRNNPDVGSPGIGSWWAIQPDPSDACGLVSATGAATPVQTGLSQLLPAVEPPVTILDTGASGDAPAPTTALPAADIGLMAPELTEILPNPAGTGNDASDEFIELYNPNSTAFDLSGFSLQTGLTSNHSYVFPAGSSLPPQAFVAFYSATTGLSLSNSGGQAKLLDPFGNSISATDVYGTAKDGQAWARANGHWSWTLRSTPNAANIISAPPPTAKKTASKAVSAKNTKTAAAGKSKASKTTVNGDGGSQDKPATTPIHVGTLALVAAAALLYGAYEYRTDLANRLHRLRRHFGTGRPDRQPSARRRDHRIGKRLGRWQNGLRARLGGRHGQPRPGAQSELHAEPPIQGGQTDPASL